MKERMSSSTSLLELWGRQSSEVSVSTPSFKHVSAAVVGQTVGKKEGPDINNLLGKANEAEISLNGAKCTVLLDTGSTVSTVSEMFLKQFLSVTGVKRHPLEDILRIECASGDMLPYRGYVELQVTIPGSLDQEQPSLFLVVPDTNYNRRVPALMGTNILKTLMEKCQASHGTQFLQKTSLSTAWTLAMNCMTIQDQKVRRSGGRLGLVKCATREAVRISPNQKAIVPVSVSDVVDCNSLSLFQPTKKTKLPEGAVVTPALIRNNAKPDFLQVEISNSTYGTVVIQPQALLCELQQVDLEDHRETAKDQQLDDNNQESDEEFLKQFHLGTTGLTEDQLHEANKLLLEYCDIFSKGEFDIGHTTTIKHRIKLSDDTPFKQRHRFIPPSMYQEVKDHLRQLVECGVIETSSSPFASPVVLVRKKNGALRFCVDYRQLNLKTVKDSYALPRIEEMIDHLKGCRYFSSLDMRAGYYQVEVEEQDKEKTAFTVGPLGFYQFTKLPFGLCNSPATFQRLMERAFAEIHMKECFSFLDDVIVPGRTFEEDLLRLRHAFEKVRLNRLKLNAGKCELFRKKVTYCGHVISEEGVETDPRKTAKIEQWKIPENTKELRTFLGFTGYYRRFVRDYSKIAKPLTGLLGGPQKKRKGKRGVQPDIPPWTWGDPQQKAFDILKQCLTVPPILAYPNYDLPFSLHTDASRDGLGAVLCQLQDGRERVISYASRRVTIAEQNYPAHKLEFLVLKWAVTEKFNDYLYGQDFTIWTDNNPLTYILTTAKLDATGHRWLAALAAYRFDIKYRPGKVNTDADVLSRLPGTGALDGDYKVITTESVGAICKSTRVDSWVDTFCMTTQVLDEEDNLFGEKMATPRDWRSAQRDDPIIGPLLPYVINKVRPLPGRLARGPESMKLVNEFPHLQVQRGVLYRITEGKEEGEAKCQLVLPRIFRAKALEGLHNDMGHLGRDRTLSLVRDRFYWPRMATDVDEWVKACDRCLRRKGTINQKAPLVSIRTSQPLELVCIDFLTLEMSKGGYQNILVITDHFTRYSQAVPTRNQTARTTAEALFNSFIVHYGFPKRLHSDQGANFSGQIIKELCEMTGMQKSRTTSYHPMGNGACERFNRTLLSMLGTLDPKKKVDWKSHVSPLVHAYNATRHDSTNQSPFYLMFGRHPRLAIDLALGIPEEEQKKPQQKYVQDLRKRLQDSYRLAGEEAEKAQQQQKINYDLRARAAVLEPGDRVLVRRLAFEGKHKIADKWEDDVYVVTAQPNEEIPVYTVEKEDGSDRCRTLHRNHLLPISSIPIPRVTEPLKTGEEKQSVPRPVPKSVPKPIPKPRRRRSASSSSNSSTATDTETEHTSEYSEYESELPVQARSVRDETDHDRGEDSDDASSLFVNMDQSEAEAETDNSAADSDFSDKEQEIEGFSDGTSNRARDRTTGSNNSVDDIQKIPEASILEPAQDKLEDQDSADGNSSTDSETRHTDAVESGSVSSDSASQRSEYGTSGETASSVACPPVPARRSTRQRQRPAWQRSSDVVLYQCDGRATGKTVEPDREDKIPEWQARAEFVASLAAQHNFMQMPDSAVLQAIMKIVSNT